MRVVDLREAIFKMTAADEDNVIDGGGGYTPSSNSRALPRAERPRVLELFCGIGGMRLALSYAGYDTEHVAVDINEDALFVYEHNWPHTKIVRKNICSLPLDWFRAQGCDIWTMSPPCQPFSRQGHFNDTDDARCEAFLRILEVLTELGDEDLPRLVVLENVSGFEKSNAYKLLIEVLLKRSFFIHPYMLTPTQMQFPNSRLRFFMIALRGNTAPGISDIQQSVCCNTEQTTIYSTNFAAHPDEPLSQEDSSLCCHGISATERPQVGTFLDENCDDISTDLEVKAVDLAKRSASAYDIIYNTCTHSQCFTKNYVQYLSGTGSVIVDSLGRMSGDKECLVDSSEWVHRLRYLHPNEVLRLMGFKMCDRTREDAPDYTQPRSHSNHQCLPCRCNRLHPCSCENFKLPPEGITVKKLWKLCGNSLNPQALGQILVHHAILVF